MLPLRFAVNFTYSFIHVKTQISSFSRYRGNLISPMWNVTNADNQKFSSNDKLRISMSANISLGLCPQSIAVKVASFFDKSNNFTVETFIKYLTTVPTSHVKLCFGKDGFIL